MSETDLENAELAETSAMGVTYEKSEPPGTQLDLVDFVERHHAKAKGEDTDAATLVSVDLAGANLAGADLSNADLTETVGLTQTQLDDAFGDDETVPPPGLTIRSR